MDIPIAHDIAGFMSSSEISKDSAEYPKGVTPPLYRLGSSWQDLVDDRFRKSLPLSVWFRTPRKM